MKILTAEDDPVTRRMLQAHLTAWGYDAIVTDDGTKAWEILSAENGPRLAILDWMMPGLDGAELCRRLRAEPDRPYVYVILLTALHREEDVVRGMEAGADDYVIKPFNPNELKARLRAAQRIIDLESRLREAAIRDVLTGLYTRRYLQDFADKIVAGATRRGKAIALLLFDIDEFKLVNDLHGHDGGDAVLRQVARIIGSSVRATDIVVRYGGDEFLAVLVDVGEGDGARVAEKVRALVEQNRFELPDGIATTSISVGVSEFPRDGADLWQCIKHADVALYRSKQTVVSVQ